MFTLAKPKQSKVTQGHRSLSVSHSQGHILQICDFPPTIMKTSSCARAIRCMFDLHPPNNTWKFETTPATLNSFRILKNVCHKLCINNQKPLAPGDRNSITQPHKPKEASAHSGLGQRSGRDHQRRDTSQRQTGHQASFRRSRLQIAPLNLAAPAGSLSSLSLGHHLQAAH